MLCAWTCCFVAEQVEAVGFAKMFLEQQHVVKNMQMSALQGGGRVRRSLVQARM